MTVNLYNKTTVAMRCETTSQGHVVRVTDDHSQPRTLETDETVFVELEAPSPTQAPQTTFTVQSEQHDVYVWQQTPGGLERWDHDASGIPHRTYTASADAVLQVVALTSGSPPPAGPPAPGSGPAVFKVKVRKKGGLPL